MKTLDLGCGGRLHNDFLADECYGIDLGEPRVELITNTRGEIVEQGRIVEIKSCDLVLEDLPYRDSFFDSVTAVDLLEHIPRIIYLPERRQPFISLINEVHRVLKPGGNFLCSTPCFPLETAFSDPTHVNYITKDTFKYYFDDQHQWGKGYGVKASFSIVDQVMTETHLITLMKKM